MNEIPELEQLLKLDKNTKITTTKTKCLTAPGENYGSLMLSVKIQLKTLEGSDELDIVAKTIPPNPKMQELFNCPVTFKNEIAMYKTIFPILENFLHQHGVKRKINFMAKYFGSRPNLHGQNCDIDKDAILLLENLKVKGFTNLERTKGFDLEGAKLVLADLALLHAVPIALKLQQPKIFQSEIRPFLTEFTVSKEVRDDWEEKYLKICRSVPQLDPYLERLEKVSVDIYPPPPPREPFATISHNDCWVNNTMVRIQNGTPVENKLVDFQICDYASPAKDVLFFLFSSVQSCVLKDNYEGLVEFYHRTFVSILQELKCDVREFSFGAMQKEFDFEARNTQFAHTVLMLFPIFAPKLNVSDMSEMTPSDFGTAEPTDLHKEKLVFIVEEFAKRNWL